MGPLFCSTGRGGVITSWPSSNGRGISLLAVSKRMGLLVSVPNYGDVSIRQTGDYRTVAEQNFSERPTTVAFHPNKPFALIGILELHGREEIARRYYI